MQLAGESYEYAGAINLSFPLVLLPQWHDKWSRRWASMYCLEKQKHNRTAPSSDKWVCSFPLSRHMTSKLFLWRAIPEFFFFFRYLELDLYKKKTQIFHGLWNAPNKRGTRKRRTMQLKTFHPMYGCRLNDCMKTTQSLSQSLCQCRSFSWAASSAVTKNNNYTLPVMRVFLFV